MPSEVARFGDGLELDRGAYELRRSGRALKLERIPLDILFLLVESRGQLVYREDIIERVWGKDVFLDTDSSINGAIRKIRQVLKDDPENPVFVQTVMGKGYRFIASVAEANVAPDRPPVEYVGCLMLSPLAGGLFQRAIMQSGVPLDLHPSVHHPGGGVDSAEKLGVDLAHKLAGEDPDAIKKLRSASTGNVFKASADMGFDAVVDGWVLPDQPLVMFAHHRQADVPVMVGSTAREFSNLVGPDVITPEKFRDWVKDSFQPVADDVLRMYPGPTPADARDAFIRAGTELDMIAPARWTASAMQGMKSKPYLYHVTWIVPTPGGHELGAFHGTDVAMLFDSPKLPQDEAGNALADAMRRYWVQFARTGSPNASGLPNWPAYDAATGQYLELGSQIRSAVGLHEDAFHLLDRLYTARLAQIK
jgi:DNA-binding winged helix-turn-helix (wHTH) protein